MEKLIRNAVCVLEIMRRRGSLALLLSENGMNIEIFHHIWQKSDKNKTPKTLGTVRFPGFPGLLRASRKWDSNPRPTHYECVALPTELIRPTEVNACII